MSDGILVPFVVTEHDQLMGLVDDDHTQYLLANGSRALAGAWDMGSQNLTNVNIDSGTVDGITSLTVANDVNIGAYSLTAAGVVVGLGVVGTPSISFSGDSNTGIYSIADNHISFATGGVLRADIHTSVMNFYVALNAQNNSITTTGLGTFGAASTLGLVSVGYARVNANVAGYKVCRGSELRLCSGYSDLTTSTGYLFINAGNQLVFDTSQQSATDDTLLSLLPRATIVRISTVEYLGNTVTVVTPYEYLIATLN